MGNIVEKLCKHKSLSIKPPKDAVELSKRPNSDSISHSDQSSHKPHISISDFNLESKLGQGAYGSVYRGVKITTKKEYAIKIVKKKMFKDSIRIQDALNEKNVMTTTHHPFIVKLHYAFQDEKNIYYAMDFCKGGTLTKYIKHANRLSEDITRFYCAQILVALRYLHETKKIVYRDLKPDNILVDDCGYIKLSDFGLSAMNIERLTSICGTYEYIAPEILRGEEYTDLVDYFSLGCLIYEMLHGKSPFLSQGYKNRNCNIIKNILAGRYQFIDDVHISPEVKDLITKLLENDPKKRLGANSGDEIQNHPFFNKINWKQILNKELTSPLSVHSFRGYVERKNRFTEEISEPNTSLVIKGFDYASEEEMSTCDDD